MKKRIVSIILISLITLFLSACEVNYDTHVDVAVAEFYTTKKASLSFKVLSSKKEYTLVSPNDISTLKYEVELEEGSATAYIDYGNQKEELFKINGGEKKDSSFTIKEKGTFTITIEPDGKMKKGKFVFEVK